MCTGWCISGDEQSVIFLYAKQAARSKVTIINKRPSLMAVNSHDCEKRVRGLTSLRPYHVVGICQVLGWLLCVWTFCADTGAELALLVVSSCQQQQRRQHCTPAWRVDSTEFESQQEQEILSPEKRPDQLWGPGNLQFNRYGDYFLRVRRPERDDNHSHLFRARGENERSNANTPLPPPVYMPS